MGNDRGLQGGVTTVRLHGGTGPEIPRRWPAGESEALERWRAAVGPPLLDPWPGGLPGGIAPKLTEVRFVTWNLRVGAGDLEGMLDLLHAEGRPFVLLLQEALRTGDAVPDAPPPGSRFASRIADPLPVGRRRSEIGMIARERGLAVVYAPLMRNGGVGDPPEDRGNAILSSLPLEGAALLELPVERQRRVALSARVRVRLPDGEMADVEMISVHLENRAPWSRFWRIPGAAREAQARALVQLLRVPGDSSPAALRVLGGDLNSWWGGPREGAVRELRSAFPHPLQLEALPTHHWELGLDRQSDYLLFHLPSGWRGEAWRGAEERGSDHWPIEGRVVPL